MKGIHPTRHANSALHCTIEKAYNACPPKEFGILPAEAMGWFLKRNPMRASTLLFSRVVVLLLSAGSVSATENDFTAKAQPFFKKHCLRCHGPERIEGDVRVDQLSDDLDDLGSVDALQNMLDEITVGSMPPSSEPRPSDRELKEITLALSKHITEAKAKHSAGGGKPIRRLTRTEYVNTIYDLLGVRVDEEELPEDRNVGSFDTEAILLYTTDMHIQKCLTVAQDTARRFIASRNHVPGQKQLESRRRRSRKKKIKGKSKKLLVIRATDIPPAGFQVVRVAVWKNAPEKSDPIFTGPSRETQFEITGTQPSPQHIERIFYKRGNEEWAEKPGVEIKDIQYFQVTNPQPYQFFEKVRKRYGDQIPDSAAGGLILDFVTLMNRGREVDKKLVKDLVDNFHVGRRQGQPFWEAMVQPMALAMCTMEAMFHFETRGNAKNSRYVSPIEMVNRVSYFLWRSAPDAKLIQLAQSEKWYEPKVRTEQLLRMIEDEKFDRFLNDFAVQWLELDRQDEIAVDKRLFPDFDSSVKASMKEETVQFLSHVIREDLPLRNLIDSDFMLINNHMAKHYDLPPVRGDDFQVVPVPSRSNRGGILTHAGILMQTGTGERTSIVERGAFVARKLLNDPPGPPPPLVDELPSSGKTVESLSAAQLVALHRKAPQCASCHNKIDSLGTGLEEFDAVGLVREVDTRIKTNLTKRQRRRLKKLTFELPLETTGQVQGKRFKGVKGLKKALLAKESNLAEAYIQALLSMANGRKSGVADETIVQAIIKQTKNEDLPALSILNALLKSDAFKTH